MTLAMLQQQFLAAVVAEDQPLPDGWDGRMAAGIAIYRHAYRARLVEALTETFPRTAQWVGEASFAQAVAHHVILHPPCDWTLDMAGRGFDATLADLFANDPEVADLAWLEWAMHRAYTAADRAPLDADGFAAATRGFGEEDWASMRLDFVPSLHRRAVLSDCGALWQAMARGETLATVAAGVDGTQCIVWRDGLTPAFLLVPVEEGCCLSEMMCGQSFGEICAVLGKKAAPEEASAAAGAMLGRWLSLGLVSGVSVSPD